MFEGPAKPADPPLCVFRKLCDLLTCCFEFMASSVRTRIAKSVQETKMVCGETFYKLGQGNFFFEMFKTKGYPALGAVLNLGPHRCGFQLSKQSTRTHSNIGTSRKSLKHVFRLR